MIRVVLGRLDGTATVSMVADRVMVLGDTLLCDGERFARKASSIRGIWLDEHGRGWHTLDFFAADAVSFRRARTPEAPPETEPRE